MYRHKAVNIGHIGLEIIRDKSGLINLAHQKLYWYREPS